MCATICGRFRLNEGGVAGYVNRMRVKYTAKWGSQIAEMIFQTRSSTTNRICRKGFHAEKGADRMLNIFYGDVKEAVYNTAAYFKYDYEDS